MPKRIVLGTVMLMLIFILSSCSALEQNLSDEYQEGTDYQYMFHSSGTGTSIASTEQGYYLLNGNYIYYMDKQQMIPVLLDNRPDQGRAVTEAEMKNSNAYVPRTAAPGLPLLQYYENFLYTIELKDVPGRIVFELVRRNPDGSNRKIMKTFPTGIVKSISIHRGYIYYTAQYYDKDNNRNFQLHRLPLAKLSNEPETLYVGKYEKGSLTDVLPYGSQVYFLEWTDTGYVPMRYDLKTSTVKPLWVKNDGGYASIISLSDQYVYFQYYYPSTTNDNSDLYDKRSHVFYRSKLDGADVQATNIQSSPILSNVYMDRRYTYVRPVMQRLRRAPNIPDDMKIYKGEDLVDSIEMSRFRLFQSLVVGDENFMFLLELDGLAEDSMIYYLDKSEIESGHASFKKLVDAPVKLKP